MINVVTREVFLCSKCGERFNERDEARKHVVTEHEYAFLVIVEETRVVEKNAAA